MFFWGFGLLSSQTNRKSGYWNQNLTNNKFEIWKIKKGRRIPLDYRGIQPDTLAFAFFLWGRIIEAGLGFWFVHSLWCLSFPHEMCVFPWKHINFHGVTLEFSCPARMQTEDAREPNECTIPICVSMQFGIGAIAYDDDYHHLYWFELMLLHPSQCWRKSHVISTFNAGFFHFFKWPETCCFALHCWNQTVDVRSHHLKEFAGVSDAFWHSIAMTKPKCILLSYEIYINLPLLRFPFLIS